MCEMKMIPAVVWEKECRYCCFRATEENFQYGSRGRYERPCRIGSYDDMGRFYNEKTRECDLREVDLYPTSCRGFRPNNMFGLCKTCKYHNSFHDENNYCTHIDGPLNRRIVFPNVKQAGPADCWKYENDTCDRYKVDESDKKYILKSALEGKVPTNFDPETWQGTEYIDGEPSEEWERKRKEFEDNKPENIRKKALKDKIRKKIKKVEG